MNPITVYTDGRCPMCVAGAVRFRQWDKVNALRFVDMHDPVQAHQAEPRFSEQDLQWEMRVQMPDGSWRSGYFAWTVILSALPVWRFLGLLMQVPLFYAVGPAVYRWVAAHRLQISRTLRLTPPCDENGVCRLGLPSNEVLLKDVL